MLIQLCDVIMLLAVNEGGVHTGLCYMCVMVQRTLTLE